VASGHNERQIHGQQYVPVHVSRLTGHEGSIFRIAWSSDGLRLISASDERKTALASGVLVVSVKIVVI